MLTELNIWMGSRTIPVVLVQYNTYGGRTIKPALLFFFSRFPDDQPESIDVCKNKKLIPTFKEAILITFSDAKDNTFPVFTHRLLFLVVPQHTPKKNKISR